jgi:hypothetical protein
MGMDDTTPHASVDAEHADLVATPDEGPALPSDEAEDRNKSPEGGRGYQDNAVAVDPEDAPSANSFMVQITIAMFVVVALMVATALTGSTVLLIIAFVSILLGLGTVLKAVFKMMSTD